MPVGLTPGRFLNRDFCDGQHIVPGVDSSIFPNRFRGGGRMGSLSRAKHTRRQFPALPVEVLDELTEELALSPRSTAPNSKSHALRLRRFLKRKARQRPPV